MFGNGGGGNDSDDMLDDKYLRSNSIACNDDKILNQSIRVHMLFKDEPDQPSEVIINSKNQEKTDHLIRMSIKQS